MGSKLSASPFLGRIVVSHLLIWWKLRLQISTAAIAFKMGVVSKIIRCQSVQIFSRASKPTTSVSCSSFLGSAPFLSSLSWNKICCSVDVSPKKLTSFTIYSIIKPNSVLNRSHICCTPDTADIDTTDAALPARDRHRVY